MAIAVPPWALGLRTGSKLARFHRPTTTRPSERGGMAEWFKAPVLKTEPARIASTSDSEENMESQRVTTCWGPSDLGTERDRNGRLRKLSGTKSGTRRGCRSNGPLTPLLLTKSDPRGRKNLPADAFTVAVELVLFLGVVVLVWRAIARSRRATPTRVRSRPWARCTATCDRPASAAAARYASTRRIFQRPSRPATAGCRAAAVTRHAREPSGKGSAPASVCRRLPDSR